MSTLPVHDPSIARNDLWNDHRLHRPSAEHSAEASGGDRGAFVGSIPRTLNHVLLRAGRLRVAALLLVIVGAGSCATTATRLYEGPERPAESIAFLSERASSQLDVVSIDGRRVSELGWQLLPGRHDLVVELTRHHEIRPSIASRPETAWMKFRCVLTFTAVAGRSYEVASETSVRDHGREMHRYVVSVWLENPESPDTDIHYFTCESVDAGLR